MGASQEWLLWQLGDSAFPSGSFAHSGGLESLFQFGELRGREQLAEFLQTALANAARSSMPFAGAAFDGAESFERIDTLCDAFLSNHVANRSSRAQGRAFLASCERVFENREVTMLRNEIMDLQLPGHLAPAFGRVCRAAGLERMAALRLWLFQQLRSWISSAVRLGIVGPIEAQRLQFRFSAEAEVRLAECAGLPMSACAQTSPLIDLFQGMHDRLGSRLFQS